MIRAFKYILIIFFLLLTGCNTGLNLTPLVESGSISIYLIDTPVIADNQFYLKLQFRTSTADSHLIQKIVFVGTDYFGLESFRICQHNSMSLAQDCHGGGKTDRLITIMPGVVFDADETSAGFAMLPANWPPGFNLFYINHHNIQGVIVKSVPVLALVYRIKFDGKVLEFSSGDTIFRWGDGR